MHAQTLIYIRELTETEGLTDTASNYCSPFDRLLFPLYPLQCKKPWPALRRHLNQYQLK